MIDKILYGDYISINEIETLDNLQTLIKIFKRFSTNDKQDFFPNPANFRFMGLDPVYGLLWFFNDDYELDRNGFNRVRRLNVKEVLHLQSKDEVKVGQVYNIKTSDGTVYNNLEILVHDNDYFEIDTIVAGSLLPSDYLTNTTHVRKIYCFDIDDVTLEKTKQQKIKDIAEDILLELADPISLATVLYEKGYTK